MTMGWLTATTTILAISAVYGARTPQSAVFRPELIEPGKTPASQLKELLGKPMRVVREGASREYHFYESDGGSTMSATIAVRSGVVEYMTYLCRDSIKDVQGRFGSEPSTERMLERSEGGYRGALAQLLYEARGRGYVYEPKTLRVKACVAWQPGRKFDELGR